MDTRTQANAICNSAFEFGKDQSATFQIVKRGHHRLDHVHWLQGNDVAMVSALKLAARDQRGIKTYEVL